MRSRGDPVAGWRPGRPAPERRLWKVVEGCKGVEGVKGVELLRSQGTLTPLPATHFVGTRPSALRRGGIGSAHKTASDDCQLGGGSGSGEDRTMRSACRPSREKARRAGDTRSPARAVAFPVAA